MALHLRNKIALATVPEEESAKPHKPGTQLPHNRSSTRTGLKTGHYNNHSWRSATIGSTPVARRAGSQVASSAMAPSKSDTPEKETASLGFSPKPLAAPRPATPPQPT